MNDTNIRYDGWELYYGDWREPEVKEENEKMIIDDYVEEINEWATKRGLNETSNDKQLIKLTEELGELAEGHNKNNDDKVVDSLGDMFVVMTIYCLQRGINLSECINEAVDTIMDRKGKLVDGVFIKEEDLTSGE